MATGFAMVIRGMSFAILISEGANESVLADLSAVTVVSELVVELVLSLAHALSIHKQESAATAVNTVAIKEYFL